MAFLFVDVVVANQVLVAVIQECKMNVFELWKNEFIRFLVMESTKRLNRDVIVGSHVFRKVVNLKQLVVPVVTGKAFDDARCRNVFA